MVKYAFRFSRCRYRVSSVLASIGRLMIKKAIDLPRQDMTNFSLSMAGVVYQIGKHPGERSWTWQTIMFR